MKHPSGLPRDHKSPKILYVDSGEPLVRPFPTPSSISLQPHRKRLRSSCRAFSSTLVWSHSNLQKRVKTLRNNWLGRFSEQSSSSRRAPKWNLIPSSFSADSRFTDWSELSTGDAKLDDIFAEAETRAHGRGVISTRRALASFIRWSPLSRY